MIAFPEIRLATIPAGTLITHELMQKIISAAVLLDRPLLAEEVQGIVDTGQLTVFEDVEGDLIVEIGDAEDDDAV